MCALWALRRQLSHATCSPLTLPVEVSWLKYTSISGLYKMSVWQRHNLRRSVRKEFVFGFAGTALSFRSKMLRCLIALGRKGRLCLYGLPDIGLSWPYLPIWAETGCRLRVVFQLFWLSFPSCVLALLCCSPWERVVCLPM